MTEQLQLFDDKLTFDQFVPLAIRTESVPTTVKVNLQVLGGILALYISAGTLLDYTKKGMFYGNYSKFEENYAKILRDVQNAIDNLPEMFIAQDDFPVEHIRTVHGIIGMATESVELAQILDTYIKTGGIDAVNLAEEIGDSEWYKAILVNENNLDLGATYARIIKKLKVRFPEKFDAKLAANRDLETERKVLEGLTDIAYDHDR